MHREVIIQIRLINVNKRIRRVSICLSCNMLIVYSSIRDIVLSNNKYTRYVFIVGKYEIHLYEI